VRALLAGARLEASYIRPDPDPDPDPTSRQPDPDPESGPPDPDPDPTPKKARVLGPGPFVEPGREGAARTRAPSYGSPSRFP